MPIRHSLPLLIAVNLISCVLIASGAGQEGPFAGKLDVKIPHISTDKSIKYDYDIVYVRAKRAGDKVHKRFYTDIATPVTLEPGADLMLLHPNGKEEVLVKGSDGAVTDPVVSFDGAWVYYTLIHTMKGAGPWQPPLQGADIYKIHVKSRKIVRLTNQEFTPNTGAADWSSDYRKPEKDKTHLSYGVLNFGAYPLPGGRIVFTSNRNAFRPPRGYPRVTLQLFVMDDDGRNVECIGHLNVAGALHPVVLRDGRILFSSLESQGIRGEILWGIWSIHSDGTNWSPVVSAFDPGGAPNAFHFQTQLSDGSIVVEGYYNLNNSGFGTYIKIPETPPEPGGRRGKRSGWGTGSGRADSSDKPRYAAFGPANMQASKNKPWRFGRHDNGQGRFYRMPFMPRGSVALTPFARIDDGPADLSDPKDKNSPRVGKFTHPSGAPENHLLTVYSPGPANHQYTYLPQIDGGIYLLKDGKPIDEPAKLRLIKNDPEYNEQWPRALVPYKRIYGIDEPKRIAPLANDGKQSPHLPEGTPFGLVGTSSLYKRESYPNGFVNGGVTARYHVLHARNIDPWLGLDAFTSHGNGMPLNWHNQGAEAGLYRNQDIHAIRIVTMEPTTDRNRGPRSGRLFHSHARERLRILGEIPVRKWNQLEMPGGVHPIDPDGHPDTSFLARIPADVPFTFQTLDKDGMLLNMAQTWHQLRPGEVRTDCGGCHAHSQKPTPFERTAAAKKDYSVWDLTERTPLLTARDNDESKQRWDHLNSTGLRFAKRVTSVEYHRDVKPIFERSCIACHSVKCAKPAGNLALDGPDEVVDGQKFPGGYYRLAMDSRAKYGHKPVGYESWGYPQASRYVRMFQSRRSLLIWKVYGKRLDGLGNDFHPAEPTPGAGTLVWQGRKVDTQRFKHRAQVNFAGVQMPPRKATAAPDGKLVLAPPLSDEDRRTLTRWIDLGCPIDLDFDPRQPERRGYGFACDDTRPTLTLTYPRPGRNDKLDRLLVGMFDHDSGLDEKSFRVVANFLVDGLEPGTNLGDRFRPKTRGVHELRLKKPIDDLKQGTLTVSVKDRQGNISRIVRTFSVGR
jgi:hypothetical protein